MAAESLNAETVNAPGPGNIMVLVVESEHVTEVFSGFGRRGLRAETVAQRAVDAARRYLEAEVPVGEHLADQLLLPLAWVGTGSFLTSEPTSHFHTNVHVLTRFLDVDVTVTPRRAGVVKVELRRS